LFNKIGIPLTDWEKFSTWEDLSRYFGNELPTRGPSSVWAVCLLPNVSIQELPHLARRKSYKNSSFAMEATPKSSDFWLVTMRYKGQIRKRVVSIPLHIIEDGWVLLFDNKAELELAKVLTRRLYPRISRAHLVNYAFEELVRLVIPSTEFYVKPIGCDAITPPTESPEGEPSKGTTRARLSGPQTERILELIRQHVYNLWIDNLEFEIRDKHSDEPIIRALMTRDGLCRFDAQPQAFDIFEKLLANVVASGSARETKFSNMDRRIVGSEVIVSPARVKYHRPIETFQLRMMARDLTRRTIASVVHAGNPYFLAIVQDFLEMPGAFLTEQCQVLMTTFAQFFPYANESR